MDIQVAQPAAEAASRLVGEYLEVLESVFPLLALGAPETLLPASKEEIRQAILTLARASATHELAETHTLGILRQACAALANFVSYEEANAAARLRAAFERGDRAFIASGTAAQVVRRSQQIEQDSKILARDFDDAIRSNETGTLMSELDHLLAEVNKKFAVNLLP